MITVWINLYLCNLWDNGIVDDVLTCLVVRILLDYIPSVVNVTPTGKLKGILIFFPYIYLSLIWIFTGMHTCVCWHIWLCIVNKIWIWDKIRITTKLKTILLYNVIHTHIYYKHAHISHSTVKIKKRAFNLIGVIFHILVNTRIEKRENSFWTPKNSCWPLKNQ